MDRDQWEVLANTVINLWAPWNARNWRIAEQLLSSQE